MVQILCMRHGQKDGDKLTPEGAKQVFIAGEYYKAEGFQFDCIFHSGANRTQQSAYIILAALQEFYLPIRENRNFIYTVGKDYFETREDFEKEVDEINKNGGLLDYALKVSQYAKNVRLMIIRALQKIAKDMESNNHELALVIGHSPMIVTASSDPQNTPYGILECDSILYTLDNNEIIATETVRGPIKGGTIC